MIDIDAVAVAYFKIIKKRYVGYCHIVASHKVYRPIGTVGYCHVRDVDLACIDKSQHMRPRVEIGHRFKFEGVVQLGTHERHGISVDAPCAAY